MATSDYLSSADLKAVGKDGVVNESLMAKIWDISNIPLVFTDIIGTSSHDNEYTSWVQDSLAAPNLSNAAVDGVDSATNNNAAPSARVGNHSQISTKNVSVTSRAQSSSTVGGDALAYQLSQRQIELKRDVEAIMLTGQASVADDGDTVAGKSGGLASWLETNVDFGANAVVGGYNVSTGLTEAPTYGAARAPSEAVLRDLLQAVYTEGGDPTILMSTPTVVRKMSNHFLTTTAKVATIMSDAGTAATGMTAKGAVNVFASDFGITVEIVANRLQPVEATNKAAIYIIDPNLIEISYLKGVSVEPLAKTGLADKRLMSVDWTLKVLNEKGLGGYFDIDTTATWTA